MIGLANPGFAGERPTLHDEVGITATPSQQTQPIEFHDEASSADVKEKVLKRFDSDGDGKLNKEERQAMRAALQERFAQWRQRLPAEADVNEDGSISKSEARMWFQAQKDGYDLDGDGVLNQSEREAFRLHLEELGLAGLVSWVGAQRQRQQAKKGHKRGKDQQQNETDRSSGAQRGPHRGKRGPPPEADYNNDGTITREEGRRWHQEHVLNRPPPPQGTAVPAR
jgi:hypothetical protein